MVEGEVEVGLDDQLIEEAILFWKKEKGIVRGGGKLERRGRRFGSDEEEKELDCCYAITVEGVSPTFMDPSIR